MSTPVFDVYAQYYNLLYQDKDYQGEVDYVESLIKKHKSNTKTILNLGCGTGRHDVLFAKKGFEITGVDLSKQMIEFAKSNPEAKGCTFVQGDARTVRLNKKFDVVVSLFHVISYQTTNEDLENFLKTAKLHIAEGGLLIFDCWYGPAVLTDRPSVRIKRMENSQTSVVRLTEPQMYANRNVVDVNYDVEVTDKKTAKREIVKELHSMRYLFYPEIELLSKSVGLTIINFEEWLSGRVPDYNSWNALFVLKS